MSLLDHIEGHERLALVGVAKNSGKTTTLNHLMRRATRAALNMGLLSIGVDGEREDVLLSTPKPRVLVDIDHHVVTAAGALDASSARFEYLDTLGYTTPMGEVVLARVLHPGDVLLAGIRHSEDLARALDALSPYGLDHILIDGAYGRAVAARPSLSDAVIVSTGAVVSTSIQEIVEITDALITRLTLPQVADAAHAGLLARSREENRALLGLGNEVRELPAKSALLGLGRGRHLVTPEVDAVAIPGLVSDRVAEELLGFGEGKDGKRTLLLPDGTTMQCKRRLQRRLLARWEVRVAARAELAAISYNPTSPVGGRVDAKALEAALVERRPGAFVFDPMG